MGREAFEANRVGFVALWVVDIPAQRDGMIAALGLSVRFQDEDLVVFAMEGTDLVLRRAYGPDAHRAGSIQVGFYSDDLDAATERARAAGLPLAADRAAIGEGQRATILDLPGGQSLTLVGR